MDKSFISTFVFLFLLFFASAQDNSTDTSDSDNSAVAEDSSNSTSISTNTTSPDSAVEGEEVSGETVTIAPLDRKCYCLGDAELLANKKNSLNVLELCREKSPSRITVDGLGYVAERYRCGSRTPSKPTWEWDSLCNCTKQKGSDGVARRGFWSEIQIKDQNMLHRWETYSQDWEYGEKEDSKLHPLEDPTSANFTDLKLMFEQILDELMLNSEDAVARGFVKNVVMKFTIGDGTNTTTTTTEAPKPTEANSGTADGDPGEGPVNATSTNSANNTAEAEDASERRKRNVPETTTSTTTTQIVYNSYYLTIHVETQFMDGNMTKANFKDIYDEAIATEDLFAEAEAEFPPLPTCSNVDLTDLMPYVMESMEHDKEIILKNKTRKCKDGVQELVQIDMLCTIDGTEEILTEKSCENSTTETIAEMTELCTNRSGIPDKANANISEPLLQKVGGQTIEYDSYELATGEQIEITCKDPLTRPSQDWYDLAPWDGKITAVCQSDGTYNVRATQLAICVTICDQHSIPVPDLGAGLEFTGVKRKLNGKLQHKNKMKSDEFIWAEDALVYSCKEPKYGIRGGVDKQLDMYTCKGDTGKYDVPNGLNMENEAEQEPWPVCEPQRYMVIEAVEMMLAKYDFRISNRYKLIRYEADDAKANLRPGPDHFIEVTIPAVVCMLLIIIFVLLCSKNESPVCRICAAKDV